MNAETERGGASGPTPADDLENDLVRTIRSYVDGHDTDTLLKADDVLVDIDRTYTLALDGQKVWLKLTVEVVPELEPPIGAKVVFYDEGTRRVGTVNWRGPGFFGASYEYKTGRGGSSKVLYTDRIDETWSYAVGRDAGDDRIHPQAPDGYAVGD